MRGREREREREAEGGGALSAGRTLCISEIKIHTFNHNMTHVYTDIYFLY